jgi:hypothetical protein
MVDMQKDGIDVTCENGEMSSEIARESLDFSMELKILND